MAAARERPIACPVVADLLWGEIDDPAQLARAREWLYPQVSVLDAALGVAPAQQ